MVDRDLLRQCVHCGLCLDACPTYLQLGTEADSPRGRIHLAAALADGSLAMSAEVVRHFDLCLGCRACETACPSGVPYGKVLEATRERIEQDGARGIVDRLERRLLLEVFPKPSRLRLVANVVRLLRSLGLWGVVEAALPAARLFPALGEDRSATSSRALGEERRCVDLFTGCVAAIVQGNVNAAAIRALNRTGVSVDVPERQGCCGALHLHAGDLEGARTLARANVDAFESGNGTVVVTAAGCGAAIREYGELLASDPAYAARAARLAQRVRDVTEVAAEEPPAGELLRPLALRVTYHDACHLAHAQGVLEAPRRLLRAIPGIELVELAESDLCCGSAGSYNLTEPEMARALGRRKVDNIAATGADCVAVANPGCALQIAAELRRRGSGVRVAHPLELLDEALGGAKPD
jgi:glycolate oxidase iron-sulfur subunit